MNLPARVATAVVLVAAALAIALFLRTGIVPARNETKSQFFQTYNPTATVGRIVQLKQTSGGSGSGSGGTLPWSRRDVTHKSEYPWWFRPAPETYPVLMGSLLEGISRALAGSGATITSEQVAPEGGFLVVCRAGRTTGRIVAGRPVSGGYNRLRGFAHAPSGRALVCGSGRLGPSNCEITRPVTTTATAPITLYQRNATLPVRWTPRMAASPMITP